MKIVSPAEMARIEALAYQAGASEMDFMEKAGAGIAQWTARYLENHQRDRYVLLLCGKGNNGGDGYVAGCYLLQSGHRVEALSLHPLEELSPLSRTNALRFQNLGGEIYFYAPELQFPFASAGVILDGLFGTGFRGEVQEPYASVIQAANQSATPILAIDIPSGLNGETGEPQRLAIRATETMFLGLPKTGFFLQQGWDHVGELRAVDFGLASHWIDEAQSKLELLLTTDLHHSLPPIVRSRDKYQAGYVVGLAGSPAMPGAALLASLAALRSGAGIVRLLYPDGMQPELARAPYELICTPYLLQSPKTLLDFLNHASAAFIGPGMGRSTIAHMVIETTLPLVQVPTVIDADALYALSIAQIDLPEQALLTPHRGEMGRLLSRDEHREPVTMEFLRRSQEYVDKHGVTLLLKGGPSFIFQPGGPIEVSVWGDPGMATAGSGDVLTGVLASLLAQGLSCHQAARVGSYLHGTAGELAAKRLTARCMIASDLIAAFPEVFQTGTLFS